MRPNGGWSSSGTQNMQASIGQYSMQAGEPAHPVQQSVVIASIRGRFLRVAFPSPTDIGHSFSTISNTLGVSLPFSDLRFLNHPYLNTRSRLHSTANKIKPRIAL